jgi:cytochrome c556
VKHFLLASLAIAGIVTAAAAQTGGRSPADTIQMRQANYKQMAGAVKGINDQLHAGSPSLPHIRRHSALLDRHALQVLRWFPRGTGPEAGVRTRAKPEIWSDPQGFRTAGARLLVATRTLDSAARRGDVEAIRTGFRGVQSACGGCHEGYRGPAQ